MAADSSRPCPFMAPATSKTSWAPQRDGFGIYRGINKLMNQGGFWCLGILLWEEIHPRQECLEIYWKYPAKGLY